MKHRTDQQQGPRLLWLHAAPLLVALDSATWLETTRHLREEGWMVTLVGQGPRGMHDINGVEIECLPKPDFYFLGTVLFQLAAVRFVLTHMHQSDIVLFHQMSALWLLPLKLLRILSGRKYPKFVMDTRDLPTTEGGLKNQLRTTYFSLVHWSVNRFADGQTAITPRMVELVNIPPSKLWGIWPSGVELTRFAPARAGRAWPAENEPIRLCYVGKLHLERGLLPLCEAVSLANQQEVVFRLDLVGTGPHKERLRQYAQAANSGIRIMDPVPHEEVPALLRHAHVGVTSLPAPNNEKFQASSPIKLFEYMAAGMPILSTANPCHTDVIGNHEAAFWAHDASTAAILEALEEIRSKKSFLSEMGDNAFALSDDWTWQSAARKLSVSLTSNLELAITPGIARTTS